MVWKEFLLELFAVFRRPRVGWIIQAGVAFCQLGHHLCDTIFAWSPPEWAPPKVTKACLVSTRFRPAELGALLAVE
jgi:hypothetical protein